MSESRTDFVLIFALEKELAAFLQYLPEYETRQTDLVFHKAEIYGNGRRKPYNIVALQLPKMGNYEASAITTRAIDVWRPRYVLLGGIAGGVKRADVRLGDLVVADLIVAYEPGKKVETGIESRFRTAKPAAELLESARNLDPSKWALQTRVPRPDGKDSRIVPKVHFGTTVSGEKVIADKNWMRDLSDTVRGELGRSPGKIAAVEMESYGTAIACYRAATAPGMLMAKSICDWADSEKNDNWQEYAADVSASFLFALIQSGSASPGDTSHHAVRIDAKPYSGRSKLGLCSRMGDSWEDLADYFDIPLHVRRTFRPGRECQDIWAWLEARKLLDALPDALKAIEREDLKEELIVVED